jgi:uncharacterized protein YehS (DUF1456 family)
MTYNDILRRFRYALNINDPTMLEIFRHAGCPMDPAGLKDLLKKEEEQGYVACGSKTLAAFLDGFIIFKRGKQEIAAGQVKRSELPLTNNVILRKLRIALELKEADMLGILKRADTSISKPELSAFFRDTEHKNFKACGDQFLRNFIKGLGIRHREKVNPS